MARAERLVALDDAHFLEGYTRLATHAWLLNPFAYLGTSAAARWSTQLGIGLLILAWWACVTSVAILRRDQSLRTSIVLPFLFYFAGIAALASLSQTYAANVNRLQRLAPVVHKGMRETANGRWYGAFAGTGLGVLLFCAGVMHQRKRRE